MKAMHAKAAIPWLGTILVYLSATGAMAQENQRQDDGGPQLRQLYNDFLLEEGYRPEFDGDGHVRFKREGRTYFIIFSEDDRQFIRLVLPNIWPIESDQERNQVLAAANESNARSKAAKIFTVRDNVWVVVDLFAADPKDFREVFDRLMPAIDNGMAIFAHKMSEFAHKWPME